MEDKLPEVFVRYGLGMLRLGSNHHGRDYRYNRSPGFILSIALPCLSPPVPLFSGVCIKKPATSSPLSFSAGLDLSMNI